MNEKHFERLFVNVGGVQTEDLSVRRAAHNNRKIKTTSQHRRRSVGHDYEQDDTEKKNVVEKEKYHFSHEINYLFSYFINSRYFCCNTESRNFEHRRRSVVLVTHCWTTRRENTREKSIIYWLGLQSVFLLLISCLSSQNSPRYDDDSAK